MGLGREEQQGSVGIIRKGATITRGEIKARRKEFSVGCCAGGENAGGRTKRRGWLGCWNGG
jgi:hypothetical protein